MQLNLDNSAYKIIDKRSMDYVDENLFETDEYQILKMLYYNRIDIIKGIDLTKQKYRMHNLSLLIF